MKNAFRLHKLIFVCLKETGEINAEEMEMEVEDDEEEEIRENEDDAVVFSMSIFLYFNCVTQNEPDFCSMHKRKRRGLEI